MSELMMVEKLIEIANANPGKAVKIKGIGNSMRPLLHGGRDYVFLEAITEDKPLKKGDVVLYKSFGKYKIHRIMKLVPEGYVIAGDGNQFLEDPLPASDIYLRAVGFLRNDKYISVEMWWYRVYAFLWRVIFPFRPLVRKVKWGINLITGHGR